jgi:type IV secretion system protein TrbL
MTNRLRRTADVLLLLAALAALTLNVTPALAAPTPAPAATTTDVQVVALPCWLNPVCEASKSVLDTVAEKFTDGAKEMLNDLAGAIDTATQVDLTESFFTQNYAVMLAVSAPIVLMLFLFDLVGAVLRRRNPIRSLIGVFQAVFGAALAVTFTELALGATDALSSYVLHQGMAGSAQRLSDVMAAGLVTGSSSGLLLVLAFFTMIAALAVWFILVLRKFAIYSVAVFAPIAFAGQAWAGTSRMAKRWAETLIALILSKFAISVLFAVAVSAIGTSKSITTVIGGLVMLIMALFSPWLCLKLVHFVEVHVAGEMLASMKSGATAPANAAVAGMTRAQQAQSLLGGSRGSLPTSQPSSSPTLSKPTPPAEAPASGGGVAVGSQPTAADDQAVSTPGSSTAPGLENPGQSAAAKQATGSGAPVVGAGTDAGAAAAGAATGGASVAATAAAKLGKGAVDQVAATQEQVATAGPPAATEGDTGRGTHAPPVNAGAAAGPQSETGAAGEVPTAAESASTTPSPAPPVGRDAAGPVPEGASAAPATPPTAPNGQSVPVDPVHESVSSPPAMTAREPSGPPPARGRPFRPSSDQES